LEIESLQVLEWVEGIALNNQKSVRPEHVEGLWRSVSVIPPSSPFESLRVTGLVLPALKPEERKWKIED
jgi:hypothetical protein